MTTSHKHSSVTSLIRGQHSARDLANFVKENARRRGSELSTRQQDVMKKFNRKPGEPTYPEISKPSDFYRIAKNQYYPDGDIIRKYFGLFDTIFFNDALEPHIKTKVTPKSKDFEKEDWAFSTPFEEFDVYNKDHGAIGLFILPEEYITLKSERELHYINTLLSEMCYSFLALYCCNDYECRKTPDALAKSGFGLAWHIMAIEIERACPDEGFGLFIKNVNLNRNEKLLQELCSSEDKFPIRLLSQWGLEDKYVNKGEGVPGEGGQRGSHNRYREKPGSGPKPR